MDGLAQQPEWTEKYDRVAARFGWGAELGKWMKESIGRRAANTPRHGASAAEHSVSE